MSDQARRLYPLMLLAALAGCASVISGRTQQVSFNSNPEGATVTVGGRVLGKTPFTMALQRKASQTLEFKKNGYKPLTMELETSMNMWFWGNVVIGGLFGSTTDSATGAVHRYSPSQYMVTLERDGTTTVEAKPVLSDRQKAREFIVYGYSSIKDEIRKEKPGDYLKSLWSVLKVPEAERAAALEKVKGLLKAYEDIFTFADKTTELFLPTPADGGSWEPEKAVLETEIPRAQWKSISPVLKLKVYSKSEGAFIGSMDHHDGEYIWLNLTSGARKALLPAEIEKIVELK